MICLFIQGRYRDNWSFFYLDVDGIFYVVDASDKWRLSIDNEILQEMAQHPSLKNRKIPFLIIANKQDVPESADDDDLRKYFQLDYLKTLNVMKYDVKVCTAIEGHGIDKCFKHFESYSKSAK